MSDIIGRRPVWPNYATANQLKRQTGSNTLGKDQFLHLLMTQLRHQDPIKPLEDREFIAQMTQFSLVEQVMNMSQEMTAMHKTSSMDPAWIGQRVTWPEVDAKGTTIGTKTGIVSSIERAQGVTVVRVGTQLVPLTDIVKIESATPATPATPATDP